MNMYVRIQRSNLKRAFKEYRLISHKCLAEPLSTKQKFEILRKISKCQYYRFNDIIK